MSELRHLIRELLLEELDRMGTSGLHAAPAPQAPETISIASNADLTAFAARVLTLGRDEGVAKRIASGDYPFRLAVSPLATENTVSTDSAPNPAQDMVHCFKQGVVSEKDIANLADNTQQIHCGAGVCLTPLAKDAVRHRGIKIVRNTA